MDQDAFRQLLATPAPSSAQPAPRPRFGAPPPKRSLPAASTSTAKATDFAPRKAQPPKPRKAPDGSLYRDRAAERRQGKAGDFADAEKMLEDLKARDNFSEEQLQYLGGDAHHSVLVKGLDMALLERNKHEQALRAEQQLDDVEDALDEQLARRGEEPAPAAGDDDDDAARPSSQGRRRKGKSRDELLAELKARRGGGAAGAEGDAALPAAGAESRFKPIGGGGTGDKKGKGKEAPSGWKTVGAADGDKKLRKKKKKKVVEPAPDPAPVPAVAEAAAPPAPPAPAPASAQSDPADDFEDDGDIFGGAGEYKGLDSDSDSDADGGIGRAAPPPPPPAAIPPASSAPKRKYFDDDDEEDDLKLSTAPNAVTDLAAKQAAADAAALAGADGGAEEQGGAGEEGARPARLQALAGSGGFSAKELLEMDRAAAEEDKRKAKKAKYKQTAAERREKRGDLSEADKANRDYQEMQNYLSKKKGGGGDS
ncbi:uncharacterized protein JCM10292_005456 [Rhodotorula paludigena]|uniref:uncharacterized protein n=1 Tax=Rhodotorula paludigena TaxID=86838 RepID=UPI0031742228